MTLIRKAAILAVLCLLAFLAAASGAGTHPAGTDTEQRRGTYDCAFGLNCDARP